jgi:hypothetical protein
MNDKSEWLLNYASNTYSQAGEDGVIAKILAMLPELDRWCVEFGAWDGIYLSNVRRLIEEEGYSAILIEGDKKKFESLRINYANNNSVATVNRFVGFNVEDGLDKILSSYSIPNNFDFLSIDVDGNDYHIWKAINEFRPKVICVEFNPTIPSEVNFVQTPDPGINQGCSLLSLDELARSKRYELVCVLRHNAIFVDQSYFPKFEISNNQPEVLRKDLSNITWFFLGYDGTVHLAGSRRMHWHNKLHIDEKKLQILPRVLRSYYSNYSIFQKLLFRFLKKLRLL